MRHKIYLELVVLKPENAVHLTEAEQQAIPCHFLLAQEAEKRMLVIEYTPGSERATRSARVRGSRSTCTVTTGPRTG